MVVLPERGRGGCPLALQFYPMPKPFGNRNGYAAHVSRFAYPYRVMHFLHIR